MENAFNTIRKTLCATLGALAFCVPAIAQELDFEALQSAAQSGEPVAQRVLGEALVFGLAGVEQDTAVGIDLLDKAATAGDVAARASLGQILFDGYYVAADPDKGARLLDQAATAGSAKAQTTLGIALLWGQEIDPDPVRAQGLLGQAAGQGDAKAMQVLGEQLLGGWVLERDIDAGQALLEQAIAAGDTKAKVALGSFLLYGNPLPANPPRALALFEQAAQEGDGRGLEQYGTLLMWSERDAAAAEAYLVRAGELGVGAAWASLAEGAMYGYLGAGSRGKFDGYAAQAREAGETKLAVLDAQRLLWGISMRASGPEAEDGLVKAAEAGNAEALKYLLTLVRDGNRYNVRKTPDKARDYLDRFSDLLTPTERDQYGFTIAVAKAETVLEYQALAAEYQNRADLKSDWFGVELYAANPNFAIYALQDVMKSRGVYDGILDGFATRTTLRGLWLECQTLENTWRCGDSVLHPEVIGPLLAR